MTDMYVDEDFETEESDGGEETPRGLRQAARKGKKLESENQQLKRELAFFKAGIDIDDPRMRYFVKGYDGELTVDAVRGAATEAGFLQQAPTGPDPQAQAINSAQQRVISASAGAFIEDSSEEAAYSRLEAAMEDGGVNAMLEVARQYGIPIATEQ